MNGTFNPDATCQFTGNMPVCLNKQNWVSFRLVDEHGDGRPYAGLKYRLVDDHWTVFEGVLDANGFAEEPNLKCGILTLLVDEPYSRDEKLYQDLMIRKMYKLPITALQACAEKTRFINANGKRTGENPEGLKTTAYFEVEVSELVRHSAHLPPLSLRSKQPPLKALGRRTALHRPLSQETMDELDTGIRLRSGQYNVLEVRPLRALRPALSTSTQFNLLNLYNLACLATLSYRDFGQVFNADKTRVSFPDIRAGGDAFTSDGKPIANYLAWGLGCFEEPWELDTRCMTHPDGPQQAFYPIYEDVPYSERFEVVPYDPTLYEVNDPSKSDDEHEHPQKVHFFDDRGLETSVDAQAYMTHHDKVILLSIRGTSESIDWWLNLQATQTKFEGTNGFAHYGFHSAYKAMYRFVLDYLERFYNGQQIIISGHSMGGAVAFLVADQLRRDGYDNLQLYTYGAARAATREVVNAASDLVHYRMVNNMDVVPLVPSTWMNLDARGMAMGLGVGTLLPGPGGTLTGGRMIYHNMFDFAGDPFIHHGELHHCLYVKLPDQDYRPLLWQPNYQQVCDLKTGDPRADDPLCNTEEHGRSDESMLAMLKATLVEHLMPTGYLPSIWSTLRRWQIAQESGHAIISPEEMQHIQDGIEEAKRRFTGKARSLEERIDEVFDKIGRKVISHGPGLSEPEQEMVQVNEMRRVLNTFEKDLNYLSRETVTEAGLYGSRSASPALQDALTRWFAHDINRKKPLFYFKAPFVPTDQYNQILEQARSMSNQPINLNGLFNGGGF